MSAVLIATSLLTGGRYSDERNFRSAWRRMRVAHAGALRSRGRDQSPAAKASLGATRTP